MSAADLFLDESDRIELAGVHHNFCPNFAHQFQVHFVHVHRGDVKSHGDCVLHRQMPQPAHSGNDHPLAGLGLGFLEALVDRYPRTQHGCNLGEIDSIRKTCDEVRISDHVLGESAVDRVTGVLLLFAERFPTRQAVIAVSTGPSGATARQRGPPP